MIKILLLVLIICTAALVIVALATHLRVKRHIDQETKPAERGDKISQAPTDQDRK